jgi:hypothetical protein
VLVVYCCRNLWPGFYVVLSEIVSCTEAVWVLNVTEHDPDRGVRMSSAECYKLQSQTKKIGTW